MSNRLEVNECVRCGGPLVELNPKWHMCSKCIKEVEEDFKEMRAQAKNRKNTKLRHKMWMPPEMIRRGV